MGHNAGFEEKEFETLANATLANQAPAVLGTVPLLYSPGQVLERELGFDFGVWLDPSSITYKLLFGSFPRVSTPGTTGTPPALPRAAQSINTFIQYKRPTYFTPRHRQSVWRGQSFIKFDVRSRYTRNGVRTVDHSQLEALDVLASNNPGAKVRYACPSVWTRDDLYSQYAQRTLLPSCAFVDPRLLSHQVNGVHNSWHDCWSFRPAQPALGRPNPAGPEKHSDSGDSFLFDLSADLQGTNGSDFASDISDIESVAKEMRRNFDFFKSRSEEGEFSKASFVEQASKSIDSDLLSRPRDDDWLTIETNLAYPNAFRVPNDEDKSLIRTAIEVAATVKELGLTWFTATQHVPN